MKYSSAISKSLWVVLGILCLSFIASAQNDDEQNTEITGFYQRYHDFNYNAGEDAYNIAATPLQGGGFSIAHNLAKWFAVWTQVSVYGTIQNNESTDTAYTLRVINNLEGIRYQKDYGPLRLYGKAGLGFSHFGFGFDYSETKFSLGYGVGAQLWHDHFGVVLDISHITMGVPKLLDVDNRDKWDSGLVYTTGIAVRF
jgi:hypothetical protein